MASEDKGFAGDGEVAIEEWEVEGECEFASEACFADAWVRFKEDGRELDIARGLAAGVEG